MIPGVPRPKLAAGLLVVGACMAYAALSHYISTLPVGTHWAAAIAVAPMLVLGLNLGRRTLDTTGLILASALALGAMALAWPYLKGNVNWVYFLQHVAINTTLGLVFGRSLRRGRQPLCTFFASFIHNPMSPAVIHYTRQVTLAWTAFFFCMVTASALLFFLASQEAWSVFANILTTPLVGLMFVLEHLARKFLLPPEDQLEFTAVFRACQAARKVGQPPATPSDVQS